jgi:hypothetical protein
VRAIGDPAHRLSLMANRVGLIFVLSFDWCSVFDKDVRAAQIKQNYP